MRVAWHKVVVSQNDTRKPQTHTFGGAWRLLLLSPSPAPLGPNHWPKSDKKKKIFRFLWPESDWSQSDWPNSDWTEKSEKTVGQRRIGWRLKECKAQHFALFCSLSRLKIGDFLPLWGLLVELWPRFKDMDQATCAYGRFCGHLVPAPQPWTRKNENFRRESEKRSEIVQRRSSPAQAGLAEARPGEGRSGKKNEKNTHLPQKPFFFFLLFSFGRMERVREGERKGR